MQQRIACSLVLLHVLSCAWHACGSDLLSGPQNLMDIAHKQSRMSDKFSVKHAYQQMYGMYLLPYCENKHRENIPLKMLEIGLGCKRADHNPLYSLLARPEAKEGMFNGYKMWKSILDAPDDELWYAEHDKKCLQMRRSGVLTKNSLDGLHILEGDQGNSDTLAEWIRISNGNFDIIIDDGSHKNQDIYTSFQHLWPHIKPGGLYFIEDMQVGRDARYENSNGLFVMTDVIKDWIEQLIIPPINKGHLRRDPKQDNWRHPIPPGINWIACQMEACVISKCLGTAGVRCS